MYGVDPPLTVAVAVPVQKKQKLLVVDKVTATVVPSEIVVEAVWKQPLSSVIVTVCVPAVSAKAVSVVSPFVHKYEYGDVPPPPTATA
jgi:hypothetical protein